MSLDTLRTAAQFVKNLRVNWARENLMPRAFVDSVCDVSPAFLRGHGIEGIVWDVDNTLMEYHSTKVDSSVRAAYEALHSFPQVILSNSDDQRYRELGRIFPETPVLRVYAPKKGSGKTAPLFQELRCDHSTIIGGYPASLDLVATEQLDTLLPQHEHPLLRDFYALRKPHSILFMYAASVIGKDAAHIAVIGDRASTDISGGNQAGMYTIKVTPLGSEPFLGMAARWCEVGVMAWHAYQLRRA